MKSKVFLILLAVVTMINVFPSYGIWGFFEKQSGGTAGHSIEANTNKTEAYKANNLYIAATNQSKQKYTGQLYDASTNEDVSDRDTIVRNAAIHNETGMLSTSPGETGGIETVVLNRKPGARKDIVSISLRIGLLVIVFCCGFLSGRVKSKKTHTEPADLRLQSFKIKKLQSVFDMLYLMSSGKHSCDVSEAQKVLNELCARLHLQPHQGMEYISKEKEIESVLEAYDVHEKIVVGDKMEIITPAWLQDGKVLLKGTARVAAQNEDTGKIQ